MAYNKTRKFNVTIVQLPTASTVKVYYLAADYNQLIPTWPNLLEMVPVEIFLFPKVKSELAGISPSQEILKMNCEGSYVEWRQRRLRHCVLAVVRAIQKRNQYHKCFG